AGRVEVLGMRWDRDERALRQRLGVSLQETHLPDKLTVEENLRMFRSFYLQGRPLEEVLDMVGLSDKRTAWTERLSGGQKQRLAGSPAGGRVLHGAAPCPRWLVQTSFGPQREAQRGRDRAHRRAAPSRAAGDPRARGSAGTDTSVDASGDAGRRLRPPQRKAPARVNAPTVGLKSAPISPALWELTLARLRLFCREPGAVFWTF